MRSVVKRSLIAAAVIGASLGAVVLIRTLAWRSAQLAVEPISRLEIDAEAVDRLAGAIRLPTVSHAPAAGIRLLPRSTRFIATWKPVSPGSPDAHPRGRRRT